MRQVLLIVLVLLCVQVVESIGWLRPTLTTRASNAPPVKVKVDPIVLQRPSFRSTLSKLIPAGAKNGLASAMASAMVKVTMQPFDTVKTIQQMDSRNLGIFRTTAAFVKQRGVAALWSGTSLAVIGSAPAIATYFAIFNAAKVRLTKVMPPNYRPVAVALSATIANTAASVLRAPYEVLKTRMQLARHPSLYCALKHSIREEGILGLFGTGKLAVQIMRDVPYAILMAVSYEALQGACNAYRARKSTFIATSNDALLTNSITCAKSTTKTQNGSVQKPDKHRKSTQNALCGSLAGGISTFLTTPMDVVKTRLMGGDHGEYDYTSVSNAVQRMMHEEGPKAFFIGTTGRLMHKIPANGLFYIFYEAFRSLLGVSEHY